MTTVALVGASGRAGSCIVRELASRDHRVTGIARDSSKIAAPPDVAPVAVDATDVAALAGVLCGHDVVVSSVKFHAVDPAMLIAAVKAAGTLRYLVVGGAGSLLNGDGVPLVDTPTFPRGLQAGGPRRGGIPRSTARRAGS